MVSVEIDGTTIEVPEIVARLALDPSVRVAMEKVIAEPLAKDGIDSVSIGGGGEAPNDRKRGRRMFPRAAIIGR